jgi:hypothetical protein
MAGPVAFAHLAVAHGADFATEEILAKVSASAEGIHGPILKSSHLLMLEDGSRSPAVAPTIMSSKTLQTWGNHQTMSEENS